MEPKISSSQSGHKDTTTPSSQGAISYVSREGIDEEEEKEHLSIHSSEPRDEEQSSPLSIDELYPGADETDGNLSRAKRVLRKCIEHCREAQRFAEEGDQIKSDNEMVLVQNRLPDLFTYRDLGDGFGMVVDALLTSFENQDDMPCTLQQIKTVRRVLSDLRDRPYMSSGKAVDLTLQLEDAEFDTDHGAMAPFSEWLDKVDG
jgi:hypothetical protein